MLLLMKIKETVMLDIVATMYHSNILANHATLTLGKN